MQADIVKAKATFSEYHTRFYGMWAVANNSGSDSMMWYAYNDALTHFISIDTELPAFGGTPAQIADQIAWITADLRTVDRAVTPWVVAFGHKQGWMDNQNFTSSGIEQLLQGASVDLYFCGHQVCACARSRRTTRTGSSRRCAKTAARPRCSV